MTAYICTVRKNHESHFIGKQGAKSVMRGIAPRIHDQRPFGMSTGGVAIIQGDLGVTPRHFWKFICNMCILEQFRLQKGFYTHALCLHCDATAYAHAPPSLGCDNWPLLLPANDVPAGRYGRQSFQSFVPKVITQSSCNVSLSGASSPKPVINAFYIRYANILKKQNVLT